MSWYFLYQFYNLYNFCIWIEWFFSVWVKFFCFFSRLVIFYWKSDIGNFMFWVLIFCLCAHFFKHFQFCSGIKSYLEIIWSFSGSLLSFARWIQSGLSSRANLGPTPETIIFWELYLVSHIFQGFFFNTLAGGSMDYPPLCEPWGLFYLLLFCRSFPQPPQFPHMHVVNSADDWGGPQQISGALS